ncbi:MAG: FAD-dependent oxidoreductase [Actinobacteria bacterium]|nr:FAD-dependent oxidoreductase [Actinomycetota bacterium]
MSGASQARRRRGPDALEIVAFERGHFTSYSACGIPYWIGGVVEDRDELIARAPETFRDDYAIDVHLRHEVVGIDPVGRTLRVRDLEAGGERDEPYDELLVATGAVPYRPDLPGIDGAGIHGVQTLDDGQRVLDDLASGCSQAVVVGAGYIGLEMAEAMVQRGIHVHLVDRGTYPMKLALDADMGAMVAREVEALGVQLHLGTSVLGFDLDADGRVESVATEDGDLHATVVILGIGNAPNVALARDAGLEVGAAGGMVTDRRMHTPTDGVWAAGDCAEVFHRVSRRSMAIALGTIANKQGRVAGINLGGGYATFPGVVGTSVTKVCGTEVARTGLGAEEACDVGFEVVTETVRSTTRAGYYPGAKELTMKVVAEKRTGRLLGAQIVGEEGAAKRIDVFATALWNEMTVDDLLNVDLSYAPPFSPVWDPVLIAARKSWQAVEDDLRVNP